MAQQLRFCILVFIAASAVSASAQIAPQIAPQIAHPAAGSQTQSRGAAASHVRPATAEQIREFIQLTHGIEAAHAGLARSVSYMRSTAGPFIPQSYWDDLTSSYGKLDLFAAYIPAYQKNFSEQDMQSLITFYKTPAGQHFVKSQPLIAAAIGEQMGGEEQAIALEVVLRHKVEIEAARKKYLASQAPAVPTPQKK
jgi:hypothetical protein